MDSPLVSIFCLSYNHGAYLKRAFDSFDMQQLDAPIEIVIHDDASTDGSDKIIREYASRNPNVKAIIQKENQYTKHGGFSFLSEIPLAGKYVAVCEGDDYWTDPQKLSRQVAYLEAHPNCSLVFHPVRTIRSWEPNQPDHTFDGL
ncbi:MAG: glycosyltransferase, partial [Lentisphaeria bacterium]